MSTGDPFLDVMGAAIVIGILLTLIGEIFGGGDQP